VVDGQAEIIVCDGNFHGRTTTIISFSTEDQYRDGFGPFTTGFKIIPFGDSDALEAAITPNTVAFLVEPIQGEGGVNVPSQGYLARAADICRSNNVLLIADEIQTGLGRTGKLFMQDYDDLRADVTIVGKALAVAFTLCRLSYPVRQSCLYSIPATTVVHLVAIRWVLGQPAWRSGFWSRKI